MTAKKTAFAAADFAITTADYLKLAMARDVALERADAKLDSTRKEFYISAAVAIMTGAKLPNGEVATVASLQAYLIASTPLKERQARLKAGKIKDVETLPACGATVRSQFYAFKTVADAGHLERIVKGEAVNTVSREARKAKKAPTPANDDNKKTANATAPLPPIQLTNLEEMAKALADYAKTANVKNMRDNQAALARMQSTLASMVRKVEASIKADAEKAAAPKANRVRRAKAA